MSLRKFIRTRVDSDEPMVAIRDNRFYFNSIFLKLAEVKDKNYVSYFIDEDMHEIFFDFHVDRQDDNCYVFDAKRRRSSAGEVANRFNWVNNINSSRNNEDKKFISFKRKNIWGIRIRPSFEFKILYNNKSKIPSDSSGIYKYINDKNETIYIGKGNVKKRLHEQGRDLWGIVSIEYSLISNDQEQYKWENYWLEKYKEDNGGRLPTFNRISGKKN